MDVRITQAAHARVIIMSKSYTWDDVINDMINCFGFANPLTITRRNPGTYSTTDLTTDSDAADSVFYVKGAIVPVAKNVIEQSEAPNDSQISFKVHAYLQNKDSEGEDFIPMVADILTADRDYRVMGVTVLMPEGKVSGYIAELAI